MTSSDPGSGVGIGPAGLGIARQWSSVLVVAIITLGLGAVVLAWPDKTLTLLSVLVGIQLVLFGLFRLIGAFTDHSSAPWTSALVGILAMIIGVVVLRNPFETVVVLATLLGVVWIIIGAIDILSAITDSSLTDRWLVGLTGMIAAVAGIVVVSWPEPSVTVVAVIAGIYLVLVGVLFAIQAFRLRSIAHSA